MRLPQQNRPAPSASERTTPGHTGITGRPIDVHVVDDGEASCISVTPNAPALCPVGAATDTQQSDKIARNSGASLE